MCISAACSQNSAGQREIFIYDKDYGPLENVTVNYKSSNGMVTLLSGKGGNVLINNNINKIAVSHIAYKKDVFAVKDTIYLEPSEHELAEVTVTNKKERNKTIVSVMRPFMDYEINFGYREKAAALIPFDAKNAGKKIKYLKYEVIDILGVKNLKFLPFKAALYSVDTLTGMPDREVYSSNIIKKKDNKRWVKVDISENNIVIPPEGLFIVFEIPGKDIYLQEHIEAKGGIIDAVPAVRAELYDVYSPNKTYIYRFCELCENQRHWELEPCQLMIEPEFEK